MIYVIGLDSDKTVLHFLAHARKNGVDTTLVSLRDVASGGGWQLTIPDDGNSSIRTSSSLLSLDPEGSYYCRIIDLSSLQQDLLQVRKWRSMISSLSAWLEHIPGVVINRPGIESDNFCKPLHETTLGRLGFKVPASITSSNASILHAFANAFPTIVKPVSGVLSSTRLVNASEFLDFDSRRGPVHLQQYISGTDVRAHVIGEEVHAEGIRSSGIDYRRPGNAVQFWPCRLPEDVHDKIVSSAKCFGLAFMGWDFKVDSSGEYWCLEANPMPGYSVYDTRAQFGITQALISALGS
jgi:hypothetical protein